MAAYRTLRLRKEDKEFVFYISDASVLPPGLNGYRLKLSAAQTIADGTGVRPHDAKIILLRAESSEGIHYFNPRGNENSALKGETVENALRIFLRIPDEAPKPP